MDKVEEGNAPDIVTQDKRVANIPRVVEFVESWLKGFEDIQTAADLLEQAGIACAKVKTTQELLNDEHVLARGAIVDLPTPPAAAAAGVPTIKARGPWVKFSKTPATFVGGAEDLGQSNYTILTRYGLDKEEIDALESRWRDRAQKK